MRSFKVGVATNDGWSRVWGVERKKSTVPMRTRSDLELFSFRKMMVSAEIRFDLVRQPFSACV